MVDPRAPRHAAPTPHATPLAAATGAPAFLAAGVPLPGGEGELALRMPWPAEVLAVLVAAVLGAAVFLYLREGGLPAARRVLLGGLRAAAGVILVLLLFDPVVRTARDVIVPSNLLVLVDGSESMSLEDPRRSEEDVEEAARLLGELPLVPPAGGEIPPLDDAARRRAARASRYELALAALERPELDFLRQGAEGRRVRWFRFGAELEPLPGDPDAALEALGDEAPEASRTRLGEALREAVDRFAGQEVEGVVVLTDGASNDGPDPVETARRLGAMDVPVHPLPLGVAEPDDVRIGAVVAQEAVFELDRVPVRVEVEGSGYAGREVEVVARIDGEEVARERVTLGEEARVAELSFVPRGLAGELELEVGVEALEGEATDANNRATRTVRVIDDRIGVLYVEGPPRWEYRYLRAVLLRDPRLDVRLLLTEGDPELPAASPLYVSRFPEEAEDAARFDLVILGDVPSGFFTPEQLEGIARLVREDGGSLLLLAGERHAPRSWRDTPVTPALPVVPGAGSPVELHPAVHPVPTASGRTSDLLQLGAGPGGADRLWRLVRPLWNVPELEGARPGATVLATLSAGPDDYPLIAWQRFGAGKSMYVGTDSLWRLRYRRGDTHHAAFWGQAIRFLTLSRLLGENRRIRVETAGRRQRSGQPVEVWANVLDESWEPVDEPARTVLARPPGGGEPREVELRSVPDQPGLYRGSFTPDLEGAWTIEPPGADADAASPARIDVQPFARETVDPETRVDALARIAELTGGRLLSAADLPAVEATLRAEPRRTTVSEEKRLIDHWALFAVLLACLSIEWFLRRRHDLA